MGGIATGTQEFFYALLTM